MDRKISVPVPPQILFGKPNNSGFSTLENTFLIYSTYEHLDFLQQEKISTGIKQPSPSYWQKRIREEQVCVCVCVCVRARVCVSIVTMAGSPAFYVVLATSAELGLHSVNMQFSEEWISTRIINYTSVHNFTCVFFYKSRKLKIYLWWY
jgi:hypothetical protein